MRWPAWVGFIGLWSILVYLPVAHWVFAGGWLAERGALDFAGGAVVHVNAGAAALVLAIVLGARRGWPRHPMPPHSLPLTMLGTGILWFGWFGFNAGSALGANGLAAQAFINTFVAAAAAMLAWLIVERLRSGHPTTLGAASGAVAGLVAITPCAGFVGAHAVDRHRCGRRHRLLPGHQPEVQVRLRRLARRRRRPPGRRVARFTPARLLRRREREPGGNRRCVLRRRLESPR